MKKFLLSIFCLFSLVSYATAEEAKFDFTKPSGLTPSITDNMFSDAGNGAFAFGTTGTTFTNNGVTLNTTDGSTISRIWKTAKGVYDFRIYKTATMTIAAPEGATITAIAFTGSDVKSYTASIGTVSGKNWTGAANEVVFTYSATNKINDITVTYTAAAASAIATPTFSVEAGTYYNPFNVEITAEEGATVYYTTDGTEPTAESTEYTEAIAINEFGTTTTIKAIAVVEGEWSNVASATYSLEVSAPDFSVKGGVYTKLTGMNALKFTVETNGATILYNNRGGDPKTEGSKSYGSLSVLATATVKAVAFVKNEEGDSIFSDVAEEKYYISEVKPFEKATEFVAGNYLIACDNMMATPMSETSNYGRLTGKEITANNNFIETNEFYAFTFTEVEGGYNIQDTFGRYIYATKGSQSYYNTVNVGDSTKIDPTTDAAIWTVNIAEDGKATITNKLSTYTFNYSSSYKNFDTQASNAVLPTLYKLTEYPTMAVTPENWATVPCFDKVTVTCEQGISYNETEELYAYYTIGWDYTPLEFDNVTTLDENTIEFSFKTPIEENGDYRITFPAGVFTLYPSGLAIANEETQVSITVDNPNILEVTYANPDNGSKVQKIDYLYFEFNQDIFDNVNGAVITAEDGTEYPLEVTYTDSWGDATPYNALCLKTAEPITTPGEYTFVLKKEYIYAGENVRIANDMTYTFIISESLKITSITPIVESSAISDIIIECNQDIQCMAEAFYVSGDNGSEFFFVPTFQDKDGNELPYNTVRLVSETPITAAGTYTLHIEDYNITNTDWMNMESVPAQTFEFTFDGNNITTGIENIENESNTKVIYDLTGRKVKEITVPGIYIVGGKKILVK